MTQTRRPAAYIQIDIDLARLRRDRAAVLAFEAEMEAAYPAAAIEAEEQERQNEIERALDDDADAYFDRD